MFVKVFIIVLFFSFNVKAENYFKSTIGYSVSGRMEALMTSSGYYDLTEVYQFESDSINPIAIAYGHELNANYYVEAEILFGSYKISQDINDNISYVGLGLNSIFRYDALSDSVVPWTGAGLILTKFTVYDESEFGVNAQLMFGVDFKIGKNISIGPDIRYSFSALRPNLTSYDTTINQNVNLEAMFEQLTANIALKVGVY